MAEACGETQRVEQPEATGADPEQNLSLREGELGKQSSALLLQIPGFVVFDNFNIFL